MLPPLLLLSPLLLLLPALRLRVRRLPLPPHFPWYLWLRPRLWLPLYPLVLRLRPCLLPRLSCASRRRWGVLLPTLLLLLLLLVLLWWRRLLLLRLRPCLLP